MGFATFEAKLAISSCFQSSCRAKLSVSWLRCHKERKDASDKENARLSIFIYLFAKKNNLIYISKCCTNLLLALQAKFLALKWCNM